MRLLPLTVIAVYALGLRVHDYGWTSDRIVASACLAVSACYAIGYQWAGYQYDTWLGPISRVNVWTAFVVLAVLLALFTPLADPARLRIVEAMKSGECAVGEIVERMDIHQSGVSRHLRILAEAGIVRFGGDYAETLAEWARRFESAWGEIVMIEASFDDRFRRLWRFYLAYCEAGFRSGRTDVIQMGLMRV